MREFDALIGGGFVARSGTLSKLAVRLRAGALSRSRAARGWPLWGTPAAFDIQDGLGVESSRALAGAPPAGGSACSGLLTGAGLLGGAVAS
mmetsp:Transcript_40823/g.91849  ORF Transcript_40823/g.91849 Transcript_40823/m.91849 type:complete len:91 (-) Transcript_40823:182-454(-)